MSFYKGDKIKINHESFDNAVLKNLNPGMSSWLEHHWNDTILIFHVKEFPGNDTHYQIEDKDGLKCPEYFYATELILANPRDWDI